MRRPRAGVFSLERLYQDVRGAMSSDCRIRVHVCRNLSNGLFPRVQDMWIARRYQDDVNHVTGDVQFLAIALPRSRTVLTVPDLVLLKRLRGLRRWIIWFAWYWWPIRSCAAVVTISEATRSDLLKNIKCDPKKVHVIHCPVSSEFQHCPREFNESRPRILLVGTGWNKNVHSVAKALVGVECVLTIVGPLSTTQTDLLRNLGINYESHSNLSQEELVAQYASADLLVFASIFEGFGLPIVEAQAMGRPVVTSNLQPMKEVAGGAACLVDPDDCASIRKGVLRVIEDRTYRRQLVERGLLNAARFDAKRVAEQYATLYRQVSVASRKSLR